MEKEKGKTFVMKIYHSQPILQLTVKFSKHTQNYIIIYIKAKN